MEKINELPVVELPTLRIGQYDPFSDSIEIEGTIYSGGLFRDGFGMNAMIGQVLRIEKHENGVLHVTRLRELEGK
jgi:hypothetical protein